MPPYRIVVRVEVLTPRTLDEALRLKAERPEARPIAGGTDLLVELNFDRTRPETILNLAEVSELKGWAHEDGSVRLAAGLTYTEAMRPELAELLPALAEASRTVGSPQIRNRGTIGGNLGTASPAGDAHPPLLVEDALAPAARLAVRTKLGEPCARHNAVILDLVKASRPDTVVVTARSSAAYGYLFGTDREQYLSLVDASLKSLSALVPRLVIVGPVAEFPDLNMGHALFQSDATSPVSIGELPAEPFEDDARLRELARRIGARYISGVSDFCDALTCRYTLYMDATHLNLAGAQLLQPALRAALVSDR